MKLPVITIPFILILILIPILSIEGITPWLISIFFIYRIIKNSKKLDISTKQSILKISIINTILGVSMGLIFNLTCIYGTKLFYMFQ